MTDLKIKRGLSSAMFIAPGKVKATPCVLFADVLVPPVL